MVGVLNNKSKEYRKTVYDKLKEDPVKYQQHLKKQRKRYQKVKEEGRDYYSTVIKKNPAMYSKYKEKMRGISLEHGGRVNKNNFLVKELLLNMLQIPEIRKEIVKIVQKGGKK